NGDRRGILFSSGEKENTGMNGEYVLCTDSPVESNLLSWDFENSGNIVSSFASTGRLPESISRRSSGERTASAIHVRKHLKPGETAEIKIVFAWYVPEFRQTTDVDYGHYYCANFGSAEEKAIYAMDNFKRLECQSGEINDLLSKSSLPGWFAEMLCNDSYVFSTNTWLTKDGRFSVNEGPSHMFGCMGTIDQKLYGSHYYSLFFPELDRSELLMFAESQADDGGIQHDLGFGQIDQTGRSHAWPDLSSSLVILSLKHYQMTNDEEYIGKVYRRLCKALLQYQIGMDSDGDYIANISGVGNTFDSESFEGTSAYIATVWLAALLCLEEIAVKMKDKVTACKCRDIYEKAKASAITELWNGEYFVNYYDTVKKERCGTSHISQVAGDLFTSVCGLEPVYGTSYTRQALDSIFKLNYPSDLLFPTNEATGSGKMPRRNMWGWLPHAKAYLGAIPMYYGMSGQAMCALKRMHSVVSEINNNNWWDQRLFYEPDTGKQHWGRFYMSSPSTWYAYQALLGYSVDLPARKLVLKPNLPDDLVPFEGPLFLSDWWGWLRADNENREIEICTVKSFAGEILIEKMALPDWTGAINIVLDGESATAVRAGGTVDFERPLNLSSVKKIVIKWE
ncbi:MAG: GH116 family glycosyl hydrolase, partial [Lentisphaerae bacterium]|nr:GH116 family glycosyl hydrolase [Lentisphaerota bacterium]